MYHISSSYDAVSIVMFFYRIEYQGHQCRGNEFTGCVALWKSIRSSSSIKSLGQGHMLQNANIETWESVDYTCFSSRS